MIISHWPVITWLLLAEAAVLVAIAGHAWRRRRMKGARPLCGLVLAVALYVGSFAFELTTGDLRQFYWIIGAEYIGILFAAPALIFSTAAVTGLDRWLTLPRRWALLAVAAGLALLKFADPWLGAIYRSATLVKDGELWINMFERGPGYWLVVAYSQAGLLFGLVAVARTWPGAGPLFRRQLAALLLGCFFPWAALLLYLSGLSPWGRLDVVPFGIFGTTMALYWAVFHARFVAVAPVARNVLVETSRDAMVVTDMERALVDFNPAAQRLLQLGGAEWGRPVGAALARWPELQALCARSDQATLEVAPAAEPGIYWHATWQPLTDSGGRRLGYLLLVRDVTEIKRVENELQRLVAARTHAWQEAARMGLRAIEAEHVRIDRSLREAWQPEMDLLQQLEKMVPRVRAAAGDPIAAELAALVQQLGDASRAVRAVSRLLAEKDEPYTSLAEALAETLRRIERATGIFCEVTMDPTFPPLEPERGRLLLGIVREAAVNAVARGPVRKLIVQCRCPRGVPTVTILDDAEPQPANRAYELQSDLQIRMRAELLGAQVLMPAGESGNVLLHLVLAADGAGAAGEAAGHAAMDAPP